MNILYDKQITNIKKYQFKVNRGGELNIEIPNEQCDIVICFVNNKLDYVTHSIDSHECNLRSTWYVFGAIADKIKEIEESFKQLEDIK